MNSPGPAYATYTAQPVYPAQRGYQSAQPTYSNQPSYAPDRHSYPSYARYQKHQPGYQAPQFHITQPDPMTRRWTGTLPGGSHAHHHRKVVTGREQTANNVRHFVNKQEHGLRSFKPVVYPNPGLEDESDEEEEYIPQHTPQMAGYYRGDAPNIASAYQQMTTVASSHQQMPNIASSHQQQTRITQIPVQHISSSKQMPNMSQSGVVYSGIASSVPMSRAPNDNQHQQYRSVVESDYVNAPAAITSSSSDFYTEEDDFIPPAVPSKVSYGSVSSSSYTPEIKGPQYRIAADVYGNHPHPTNIQQPEPAVATTARSYHSGAGHYPEPVSSKLMYTTPVAPAAQGFVESRLKNSTLGGGSGGGPPPPTYDTDYRPKDGSMSYPASYLNSGGQPPVAKTGLYNYSTEHTPAGSGDKKMAEVDVLTQMLMQNMEAAADPDFFGMCARCGRSIMGDNAGCSALDQLYHVDCFSCIACGHGLGGQPFFAMEGKPYCESCYMNTLEKCSVCSKPITDRILRATGKPYHPGCFTCVVCGKSLDGVPFTVDATNQIHCIEDFHKKFAPRCCVCSEPILPNSGHEETIRIVAMDKSFHVGCYRCEDCGLVLSSEAEGRGCYPLDDHILCKNCNARRIQAMTTKMTTEL